jgi:hypothetical protein
MNKVSSERTVALSGIEIQMKLPIRVREPKKLPSDPSTVSHARSLKKAKNAEKLFQGLLKVAPTLRTAGQS